MKKTVMMSCDGRRVVVHQVTRAQAASTQLIPATPAPRSAVGRIWHNLVA